MKNIALLISLLFLVGCDDPTGGGKLTITKHENGKTASRGYMLNDHIKVGDWIYFYDDGSKEKVGRYFEDQMHGAWTSWHKNGQKAAEGTYKAGEEEGFWTYWHENGQKAAEGTYKAGQKDGVWADWMDDGTRYEDELWKNGERVGSGG